jgi:hypothetical protein
MRPAAARADPARAEGRWPPRLGNRVPQAHPDAVVHPDERRRLD